MESSLSVAPLTRKWKVYIWKHEQTLEDFEGNGITRKFGSPGNQQPREKLTIIICTVILIELLFVQVAVIKHTSIMGLNTKGKCK